MRVDFPGERMMPGYAGLLGSTLYKYKEEFAAMLDLLRVEFPVPGGVPVHLQPQPASM